MNIETMGDNRLIELSGRSINLYCRLQEFDSQGIHTGTQYWDAYGYRVWNPLENNDQAFRLSVEHKLSIKQGEWGMTVYADFGDHGEYFFEYHGNNPEAATRRAIVRAAAKLQLRSEGKK